MYFYSCFNFFQLWDVSQALIGYHLVVYVGGLSTSSTSTCCEGK